MDHAPKLLAIAILAWLSWLSARDMLRAAADAWTAARLQREERARNAERISREERVLAGGCLRQDPGVRRDAA